jgi:hypothetical protein
MHTVDHAAFIDDVLLRVWKVIELLGTAREAGDTDQSIELVSRAEHILSAIIPHLARGALPAISPSTRGAIH